MKRKEKKKQYILKRKCLSDILNERKHQCLSWLSMMCEKYMSGFYMKNITEKLFLIIHDEMFEGSVMSL